MTGHALLSAEDFFKEEGWWWPQSFYLGDIVGDGHLDKKLRHIERSAQTGDVGFLIQLLADLGALLHRWALAVGRSCMAIVRAGQQGQILAGDSTT